VTSYKEVSVTKNGIIILQIISGRQHQTDMTVSLKMLIRTL